MALCDQCLFRRTLIGENNLIECKPFDAQAVDMLNGFYEFSLYRETMLPFHVKAQEVKDSISAWPFRFDPASIQICAGKTLPFEQDSL